MYLVGGYIRGTWENPSFLSVSLCDPSGRTVASDLVKVSTLIHRIQRPPIHGGTKKTDTLYNFEDLCIYLFIICEALSDRGKNTPITAQQFCV